MPLGGLVTGGIISGVGSLFGGIFGASSAEKAAKEQIAADQKAQVSLQTNENQGMANLNPYLQSGSQASGLLSDLLSTPGQGLLSQFGQQFQAPTAAQAAATPGYQFQLQQGEQALQNSAAANGGLLSGGTLAGLNNYAQGVASTNYQNTFNNALTQYQQSYQQFLNNQNSTYSQLAGQQGVGLNAANSGNNLISGIGGDIASLYAQQGAARAGGTIGAANSIGNAVTGIGNLASQYGLLSSMGGLGGGGGSPAPTGTLATVFGAS